MNTNETRAVAVNGIAYSEDAAAWNVIFKGSMIGRNKQTAACQLSNISSSTALHVAYVDAGKSTFEGEIIGETPVTADDWNFSFMRLDAGANKICNSAREFNIGESLVNSAADAEKITWGTTVSGAYYIVKIFLPVAAAAVLTHCTLVKCGIRQTDTTHITLPAGESTFLVLASDTDADITLAGTGGNNSKVYIYLHTAWIGGLCQIDY